MYLVDLCGSLESIMYIWISAAFHLLYERYLPNYFLLIYMVVLSALLLLLYGAKTLGKFCITVCVFHFHIRIYFSFLEFGMPEGLRNDTLTHSLIILYFYIRVHLCLYVCLHVCVCVSAVWVNCRISHNNNAIQLNGRKILLGKAFQW